MNILRYVSDLHLELKPTIYHSKLVPLWNFDKKQNDKYYLALLGDIGNPFKESLKNFLSIVSEKYEQVFYIPGNHEYYNLDINSQKTKTQFHDELLTICSKFPNIKLMNNKTYDLNGIKLICSTLWSHVTDNNSHYISKIMNDYHLIKKNGDNDKLIPITTQDTNKWNYKSIEFIKKEIESSDKPCIVLSHHAPLFSDPINNNYTADPLFLNGNNNQAFHNNLKDLLKYPIVAWLYGHTHYVSRFKINNVVVATNQLGYSKEPYTIKFDPNTHIDLDEIKINNPN